MSLTIAAASTSPAVYLLPLALVAALVVWVYFDFRANPRNVHRVWTYSGNTQQAYDKVLTRLASCKHVTPAPSANSVIVHSARTPSLLLIPALLLFPLGLLLLLLKIKTTAVIQFREATPGATDVTITGRVLPGVLNALAAGAGRQSTPASEPLTPRTGHNWTPPTRGTTGTGTSALW